MRWLPVQSYSLEDWVRTQPSPLLNLSGFPIGETHWHSLSRGGIHSVIQQELELPDVLCRQGSLD